MRPFHATLFLNLLNMRCKPLIIGIVLFPPLCIELFGVLSASATVSNIRSGDRVHRGHVPICMKHDIKPFND